MAERTEYEDWLINLKVEEERIKSPIPNVVVRKNKDTTYNIHNRLHSKAQENVKLSRSVSILRSVYIKKQLGIMPDYDLP
jgi:hypothetical protein